MTDTPSIERDELKLLYQVSVADLAYFKQQQWSIANYALLLYAGLCAAAKLLAMPVRSWEPTALSVLVAITAASASLVLWKHETAIELRRARLRAVREQFSETFHRAWGVEAKLDERISVCWLLQGALVLGAVVSLWVLGRQ
jgi:hypothetical protein